MKKDSPTFGIIDAKSIKNVDTAEEKEYDAGKKVSGIKLHVIVDTPGLPHAMCVSCANVTDRNGTLEMIKCNLNNLSRIEKYLVDGGYSGKNFTNAVKLLQNVKVEVVKRNELYDFASLNFKLCKC
ncbi:MAG: transposase [Ruminococcus sp.]|nr:transposase [Ruminococcus sp.]